MEFTPIYYEQSEYYETSTGNKIAKHNKIIGHKRIHPLGKVIILKNVILRADLAPIKIGKYCIIEEGTVIRPSYMKGKSGQIKFSGITIGEHVIIKKDCIVSAISIGNNIEIGEQCIIGERCILKDNCKIVAGSILAPDTVVPPFTIFAGRPAQVMDELPESISLIHQQAAVTYYKRFLKIRPNKTAT